MQSKLTLRLDDRLIAKAKRWARARDVSLSHVVAAFFDQLSEPSGTPDLRPWTRRLAGAASRPGAPPPADETIRREHLAHLAAKHR